MFGLQMFNERLDGVLREHTPTVLLTDWARGAEVVDGVIVDAMPRIETVEIRPGLTHAAMLAVNYVGGT